jgi:hypothetical protein
MWSLPHHVLVIRVNFATKIQHVHSQAEEYQEKF